MNASTLLDTWTFSPIEWNTFVQFARKRKRSDHLYFGIGIFLIGIPVLMFFRNTSFLMALVFTIPFTLLVPWLRMKVSNSYLKETQLLAIVAFYSEYADMNGKKIVLYAKNKWIKDIRILTNDGQAILEITVAWRTAKGNTNEELLFPIPNNKLEKAAELITYYQNLS